MIVALMLVLSAVAWWYWPRGDARFVGTWDVSGSGVSTGLKSIRWDLNSNGIGVTTFTTPADVSASYRFLWRAEDHQVIEHGWGDGVDGQHALDEFIRPGWVTFGQ